MSMSDCPKCWSTPCVCGFESAGAKPARKRELAYSALGLDVTEEVDCPEFLQVAVKLFDLVESAIALRATSLNMLWRPSHGSLNVISINFPNSTVHEGGSAVRTIRATADNLQLPTEWPENYPTHIRVLMTQGRATKITSADKE